MLGPVTAFLIAYRLFPAVRTFALNADLRFVTATQAWRFGGFAFLALYSHGVLPGYFAWPAGLGDMAIAAAAPWMLVGLARDPAFAASRTFVTWNVLGILDLIVAVTVGAVGAAALSEPGRRDIDGRDDASPARADSRVLSCPGTSSCTPSRWRMPVAGVGRAVTVNRGRRSVINRARTVAGRRVRPGPAGSAGPRHEIERLACRLVVDVANRHRGTSAGEA